MTRGLHVASSPRGDTWHDLRARRHVTRLAALCGASAARDPPAILLARQIGAPRGDRDEALYGTVSTCDMNMSHDTCRNSYDVRMLNRIGIAASHGACLRRDGLCTAALSCVSDVISGGGRRPPVATNRTANGVARRRHPTTFGNAKIHISPFLHFGTQVSASFLFWKLRKVLPDVTTTDYEVCARVSRQPSPFTSMSATCPHAASCTAGGVE